MILVILLSLVVLGHGNLKIELVDIEERFLADEMAQRHDNPESFVWEFGLNFGLFENGFRVVPYL